MNTKGPIKVIKSVSYYTDNSPFLCILLIHQVSSGKGGAR